MPDEFVYPAQDDFDACRMFSNQDTVLNECSLERKDGKTKITLGADNYDDLVRILEVANKNQSKLFKAPKYPGDFYPITVELYENDQLREKETKNITNILGLDFDLNHLKVINGLDDERLMLYEVKFRVGSEEIPVGYDNLKEDIYSEIVILFEWQGDGFSIHKGYTKDLSTKKPDGSEFGCVS